jgi:hypothetical protein
LDSFGTGRSRSARAASAPEETPSSAPEYAPELGASAPGTMSTRSFSSRSSSRARETGGASPPVAQRAGSEPLSAEPRYFEDDRGTARQGPTAEPQPSRRLAPGRAPAHGVARGDTTRAAALACMSPCVSFFAHTRRSDAFCSTRPQNLAQGFAPTRRIDTQVSRTGSSLRAAPGWGGGASPSVRRPPSRSGNALRRFRRVRLPRRRTGSWVSSSQVRRARRPAIEAFVPRFLLLLRGFRVVGSRRRFPPRRRHERRHRRGSARHENVSIARARAPHLVTVS